MRQIALGVKYLHSQSPKIFHRDLKPANLLIFKEMYQEIVIKICDFGAASLGMSNHKIYATPGYASFD